MDQIDQQILDILKMDSKQNNKTIGEMVHLTGQAVGQRIRRLEDEGIIEKYTVKTNMEKQGFLVAFVTLLMKENTHYRVKQFAQSHSEIIEVHRISGEGCYILKVIAENHQQLNALCDEALKFANYKISIVTETLK